MAEKSGLGILRSRLGASIDALGLSYGERLRMGDVTVSLHPAGHVLGSSQVRIESRSKVAVVSGDYKLQDDRTCVPFEPQRCDLFVTESTFGMPIYEWEEPKKIAAEIQKWWLKNQSIGKSSIIYAYALGKSQRLLSMLDPSIGPIYLHGAVLTPTEHYRAAGIDLPPTHRVMDAPKGIDWSTAMIVAVPSAHGTPWLNRFGDLSTASVSGWMTVRGTRRRRNMDRGFALSDHTDWNGLIETVDATQASEVWVTHGFADIVARYLRETRGLDAKPLKTEFIGESYDATGDDPVDDEKSSDEAVPKEESFVEETPSQTNHEDASQEFIDASEFEDDGKDVI